MSVQKHSSPMDANVLSIKSPTLPLGCSLDQDKEQGKNVGDKYMLTQYS